MNKLRISHKRYKQNKKHLETWNAYGDEPIIGGWFAWYLNLWRSLYVFLFPPFKLFCPIKFSICSELWFQHYLKIQNYYFYTWYVPQSTWKQVVLNVDYHQFFAAHLNHLYEFYSQQNCSLLKAFMVVGMLFSLSLHCIFEF